jgi:glycerol uptake facilitator-like aquaporin
MTEAPAPLSRRLFAEGLGTAILVATVVGSGIMAERLAGGNQAIALLGNTIPTGAILIVIITILGPISGAHFNPAVTLVFATRGTMSWHEVVPYVLVQCLCGMVGTIFAHLMFDLAPLMIGTTARSGPSQWLAEAIATFTLILTILGGLRYSPHSIAWLVGLVITAAYWFTSSTSFANPAVTLARGFDDLYGNRDQPCSGVCCGANRRRIDRSLGCDIPVPVRDYACNRPRGSRPRVITPGE